MEGYFFVEEFEDSFDWVAFEHVEEQFLGALGVAGDDVDEHAVGGEVAARCCGYGEGVGVAAEGSGYGAGVCVDAGEGVPGGALGAASFGADVHDSGAGAAGYAAAVHWDDAEFFVDESVFCYRVVGLQVVVDAFAVVVAFVWFGAEFGAFDQGAGFAERQEVYELHLGAVGAAEIEEVEGVGVEALFGGLDLYAEEVLEEEF